MTRASLRAGVGSFGTAFADASGGDRIGRLRFYLGAHVYSSQGDYPFRYTLTSASGMPETGTVRQNDDTLEGNGVLRATLALEGRRTLGLGLIGFAREEGLPGPTNYPAFNARFHTARGLGTLRYESRDDLGPGGRLSAEAFVSAERDRLLDPKGEIQDQGPLFVHETTLSIGTTVHGTRPVGDWGRASALLEARRETYTPDNELDPAESGIPARRLVGVAGAELTLFCHPLDLEVIPSARLEGMEDTVTGHNGQGQPVPAGPAIERFLPTYRLGLVRPLSSTVTLKANIGSITTRLPFWNYTETEVCVSSETRAWSPNRERMPIWRSGSIVPARACRRPAAPRSSGRWRTISSIGCRARMDHRAPRT